MAEFDGGEDFFLSRFRGAGFNHDDAAFGTGDDDVELGLFLLRVARLDDVFTVDHADADAAEDVVERDIADGQRRRGAADGHGGGVDFRRGRKDQADNLRIAGVAFREQRADGPVDHACAEDFAVAHAAFPFQVAARDAPSGIEVLTVVDRERKERDVGFGLEIRGCRGEDACVPATDKNRTVRLFSQSTRFKGDDSTTEVDFYCIYHLLFSPDPRSQFPRRSDIL